MRSNTPEFVKKTTLEYHTGTDLLKTREDALGNVTSFTYNSFGDLKTTTDPTGNTTKNHFDADGQLTGITDGEGHPVEFEYDHLGRLTEQTDALGNVAATFTYDSLGRMISATEAAEFERTFGNDAVGKLISTGYGTGCGYGWRLPRSGATSTRVGSR